MYGLFYYCGLSIRIYGLDFGVILNFFTMLYIITVLVFILLTAGIKEIPGLIVEISPYRKRTLLFIIFLSLIFFVIQLMSIFLIIYFESILSSVPAISDCFALICVTIMFLLVFFKSETSDS